MNKKLIYILVAIFCVLIFSIIILYRQYFLLRTNAYKVYNENGESIPILLFKRDNIHRYGNEDSSIINEIILYLDEEVNTNGEFSESQVLSIHVAEPRIWGVYGGRKYFSKISDHILFEGGVNAGEDFWSLYNNRLYFEHKADEPIKFFIAEGNTYKFNTFGGLKIYGDTIIVEKLDGLIEKEGVYIAD